jgi:S-adenosylmethionine-diacylglycerol 3-amino-3-carboxypropyl transferase
MQNIINQLSTKTFSLIHSQNLVYNTCWEDPRCDRQLLDLQQDSKVVMITSAGCNSLDYLLDNPSEVHCIDMNPKQNALLELKMASYAGNSHSDLFEMFGQGKHHSAEDFYRSILRTQLPPYAQQYWDRNIDFFSGKGLRKSFYHHGTSGIVAWTFSKYMKLQGKIFDKVERMMNANSLEEQQEIYKQIEPKLFNQFMKWVMNRHLVMCMLGVPQAQQELFAQQYERGVMGYIQSCLKKVFTEIPTSDNYFWRVYINGAYSQDCCPNYLKKEYFSDIRQNLSAIQTHNSTVSDFLQKNPNEYSHYVLLDHQDWLANYFPQALEEEWRLILENSKKGTKILLRSASENVNFFPDFVKKRVVFEQEQTQKTHFADRVGTYASVYLGEVQ